MATKRLSRTVIEGGRRNKYERYQSHAQERAAARDYCKAATLDPEIAEEEFEPALKPVYKEFSDKLSPMYRWLDAQVGRPWSEVRAEVFEKFDTRTTAGRHITFCHLLREVVDTESGFDKYGRIIDPAIPKEPDKSGRVRYYSFADYYVDQEGILRGKEDRHYRHWYRYESVTEEELRAAEKWLHGRMVVEKSGKLYWITPSEGVWLATWFEPYTIGLRYSSYGSKLAYYVLDCGEYETRTTYYSEWDNYRPYTSKAKSFGEHWEKVENPFSFRQRGELNDEDTKTFRSFKTKIREDILSFTRDR